MSEVISLIHRYTHKIVWTYKNYFYDTLYSVRVWDNSECKGNSVNRYGKNDFITIAEYREKQIKSVIDD